MPQTATIPDLQVGSYACHVLINGQPVPESFQLISVQVKQAYQHITSATILFKQPVGTAAPVIPEPLRVSMPVAGAPVSIKAVLEGDEIILFEGVIVKHRYKNSNSGTRLQVTAKTKSINLALTTRTEVFTKQNDRDIINGIVAARGFNLVAGNTGGGFTGAHTQLVKNGLTDWDFINQRAEANSCFLYTEGNDIILEKPVEQVDPVKIIVAGYSRNVFELEIEQDQRRFSMEDELISFNPSSFENEMTTEDEETPAAQAPVISGKNSLVNYRTFNDLESSTLLQSTTRLKALSRHNGLVHIRASLDAKPGYTVKVEGFNEMADGSYVITSVMQDYGEGGFSTYLQFGMNLQPYSTKFNLGAAAARPVIVNGLVTALQNDPDNLHRIQVKIAAWQHAQEPVWARLATPYAGDQYGMVLLPEIGDEVIVAFMGTDFDMPVVLGSAFSPNKPPHTAFSDDNHKKIFVTRKGMKWLWDDEKGIHEISTPGGNKILISEEEHAITITDENNNKIDMNQGAINLTGSKDISIKAAANLKLEGALVDIAASGTVKVKGSIVMIN